MDVTLPAELVEALDKEVKAGHFRDRGELLEFALRKFLRDRATPFDRLEALNRLGKLVDEAGLYESVLIPDRG